ncbi:hypothetical protein [Maribacter sp. 2307ULW6-5]|uniref:hypothetical protein n=1 Tax=Maribacter sp. 2307ULW6-5 TaxID=3386275 RepID=UPI0039BD5EC8
MKKVVLSVLAVASLALTGCSDDDDNRCASCEVGLLGMEITTEACDNGDGTVTLTTLGESQVLSSEQLEGATAAEFVRDIEENCYTFTN